MGTIRTFKIWAAVAFAAACLYSCKDNIYKGFDKTENGAYMKFHERGCADSLAPRQGDAVRFTLTQTILGESKRVADENEPIEIVLEEHAFVGDIFDALSVMHPGDEATLAFLADSLFLKALEQDETPKEYKGSLIYYDLKLLDVVPAEQMDAEYSLWIDALKKAEQDYLEKAIAENKATVAKSGLVVISHKKLKTEPVAEGKYAVVDMVLCNNAGDTLINDRESVIQCGLYEICRGIDEALLMMRQGESIKCIVPSALAYDSVGMEQMILPYEPLHLDMKVMKVLNEEEYKKYIDEQEKTQQAEYEKRMTEQAKLIDKYLKDKNINVAPTESGLYIKPISSGHGAVAKPGQHVAVHYIIYNIKGEKVESSYDYGQPLEFDVGMGQMISGIEEAVMMMKEGAKAHLVMSSDLAFDDIEIDSLSLPSYSPVAIDLELVSVK